MGLLLSGLFMHKIKINSLILYVLAALIFVFAVDYKKIATGTLDYNHDTPQILIEIASGISQPKRARIKDALRYYKNFVYLQPKVASAFSAMGFCNYYLGNYTQALKDYQHAADLDPALPAIHYDLGVVYFKRNEINKAIEEFKKAVSVRPQDLKMEWIISPGKNRYPPENVIKGIYKESYQYLYWCYQKQKDVQGMVSIGQTIMYLFGENFLKDSMNQEDTLWPLFFHVPAILINVNGRPSFKL
jgi:tetratricopeptide (TPR) repeat protein